MVVDLHHDAQGIVVYGVTHPVFANSDETDVVVGAIYLEEMADRKLYPILKHWPRTSQSGEALLARQEGDEFVYLSPLRFIPDKSPLFLRLSTKEMTTFTGDALTTGLERMYTQTDYRGEMSICANHFVVNTPWLPITKVNRSEIEHLAKVVGLSITTAALIMTFFLVIVFLFYWKRNLIAITEEASKRDLERLLSILDNLPIYVCFVERDYSIRYTNNQFIKYFGEVDGKICSQMLHQCSRDYPNCPTYNLFKTGGFIEWEWTDKNGRIFQTLNHLFTDMDGTKLALEVGLEITDRKMAENSLRTSEAQTKAFFNHQIVGVAITSPQKGWLKVNDHLCQMFGYSRQEFVDHLTWSELTHPDDLSADVAQFERILSQEINEYSLEKRFVRKDGAIFYTEISVGCVRQDDGSVDYVLALLVDIGKRKEAEILLKNLNDALLQLSRTDGLTGTANRRCFDESLEVEWVRSVRANTRIGLLMIDIDYFKLYNDNYGHPAGDICLKAVASAVASIVREPPDLVARYGGEEFVCLLPGADITAVRAIGQRVLQVIRNLNLPHALSNVADYVTISIGGASLFPEAGQPHETLTEVADRNLYKAKDRGRNRLEIE